MALDDPHLAIISINASSQPLNKSRNKRQDLETKLPVPLRSPTPGIILLSFLLTHIGASNVDALKQEIITSPDLRIISGLKLNDHNDGFRRLVKNFPDMIEVPGPLRKDPPSDQHTLSFFRVNYLIIEDCRLEADIVEEALKFSDCHYVWVRNCTLIGGHEDALDVVRGSNLIFENVHFISRGARAATIKGGVDTAYFIDCKFTGSAATGAFIELGDWTDYDKVSRSPTRNIHIDASNQFDTQPITVRRGSARRLRQSNTIRPVRTYYVEEIHVEHSAEVLPLIFIPAYFEVQDLVK